MWKRLTAVLCAISLLPLSLPAQLPPPPDGYVYISLEEMLLLMKLIGNSPMLLKNFDTSLSGMKTSQQNAESFLTNLETLQNSDLELSEKDKELLTALEQNNEEETSISEDLNNTATTVSETTEQLKPSFWTSPVGITLIVLISGGLGYAAGRLHEHFRGK